MPAAGDCAATVACQRGHVTAAGHLNEYGQTSLQCCAAPPRSAIEGSRAVRAAASRSCANPLSSSATTRGARVRTSCRVATRSCAQPTAHQRLRLSGTRITSDQRRTAQLMGAQHRHLPGVRVGRTRLGERVVAVVPHHHQPEIRHGREHRAAGPDDDAGSAAQHRQPPPVALRWAKTRRQRHHMRFVDKPDRSGVHRVDVALIGHDDQRTAAGVRRHRGKLRRDGRPSAPRAAPATPRGQHAPRAARRGTARRPCMPPTPRCPRVRRSTAPTRVEPASRRWHVAVGRRAAIRLPGCPHSARRPRRQACGCRA